MSRAEIARVSYLLKSTISKEIMTGRPSPSFTVIYHSLHYLSKLRLALIGHEHGWSIHETNSEDNHEYRHVVMTCTCGESIRVLVPPKGAFSGIAPFIHKTTNDDSGFPDKKIRDSFNRYLDNYATQD